MAEMLNVSSIYELLEMPPLEFGINAIVANVGATDSDSALFLKALLKL